MYLKKGFLMEVPYKSLAPSTLEKLLEHYILREGTDYGSVELSMEQKVERLQKQLELGRVKIVYDQDSDSCNIIPSN